MQTTSTLDNLLDPLAQCFTREVAQQVVSMQPNLIAGERLEELRSKANEGELSDEERVEYESIIEAIDFVAILQAKSRWMLAHGEKL